MDRDELSPAVEDPLEAVDSLVEQFRIPLEGAGAQVIEIHGEFQQIIEYATQFISLSIMDYHSVWWRLFNAPDSSQWTNVLTLVCLLFFCLLQMARWNGYFLNLLDKER